MHWSDDMDEEMLDRISCLPQGMWALMTEDEKRAYLKACDPMPKAVYPKLISEGLISNELRKGHTDTSA